ncbi:lysine transporter LysE [Roseomonas sp. SSH11]|uniref:Lysine transporter LysE n=1 Tax=Pararoseomonas baculiformis TaxID=2820812 RepID=A0ABS4AEX2_9PROT|nr:lysine transporter LysE [Pararoseomonas baculiformis]MBP0445548.1 lysine transporter LysE [Pararoseomonas baculiformis]
MQDPVLFTLTVLLILGTPGPTNTLLATAGGAMGFRRAAPLVPAEAAGYLISILVIGLVIGPVIASAPTVLIGLRVTVGLYLIWLAAMLWRNGAIDAAAPVTARQVFITTLLNPKSLVLALGVIPFGAPPWWPFLLGFLLLLTCVAISWIALGALLGSVASTVARAGWVPRIGATIIGAFALTAVIGPLFR